MRFPARSFLLAVLLALLAVLISGCERQEQAATLQGVRPLYVAIGASDSVGTGARDPAAEGWVVQLHQRMPAGTRLANLGINGLKLNQALEQVLPVAVDLNPTVVTVWLAVNDLAGGVPLEFYRADLDTLLGTLTRETRARVYVANVPNLTLLPAFSGQNQEALHAEVLRWNAAIAASAAANGAVLVDLYSGWAELRERRDFISRDGLHPSSRGHRRLAEIFWNTMQGA